MYRNGDEVMKVIFVRTPRRRQNSVPTVQLLEFAPNSRLRQRFGYRFVSFHVTPLLRVFQARS